MEFAIFLLFFFLALVPPWKSSQTVMSFNRITEDEKHYETREEDCAGESGKLY